MTTDSLRNVKDRFSGFVDRIDRKHQRIVVTRNGRPAAVLISPDDLDHPRRVGRELRHELAGLCSARRKSYWVRY